MTPTALPPPRARDPVTVPGELCVLIYGAPETADTVELTLAAAAAQVAPATEILVASGRDDRMRWTNASNRPAAEFRQAGSEGLLAAGLRAARATGARWLWLLDGSSIPEPGALGGLLAGVDAVSQGAAAPLLVSSRILSVSGHLCADAIPRHEIFEKERSVEATARCLVQLRTACHGSLLVSATAVDRFEPPRSDLPPGIDLMEWSARLLRHDEDTGYLAAASVAVRSFEEPVRESNLRLWLARMRASTGSGWSPTERLWEVFLIGEEILALWSMRKA
ncbi:MAG: hypothetical protein ACR2ND_06545 [Solirubrobacteraceae bacterium]